MRKLCALFILAGATVAAFAAEEAHGGKAGGGGLMQQLHIEPLALLTQFIAFAILFAALYVLLWKPLAGIVNERQQDVHATYEKIEADKAEMARLKSDYEQRLASIEAEGRDRIQAAIKEAETLKNQILDDARVQADRIRDEAAATSERDRQRIMLELRSQVADLSLLAAEKLIGANLDDTKNRKLVEEFIQQAEVRN